MKKIDLVIITILIISTSTVLAQDLKGFVLEKRNASSTYTPKQQLQNTASEPKINKMTQDTGFISVQVNTDSNHNNILNDAANEPSIAVNPLNPNQIAIGWRQFNTVTSDFRQAGKSYSDDGGQTWNYQQVFEPGVFRSDPVLASNADGEFYYQSLKVVGNTFRVDQWKSYNGGKTWVEKTHAYGGDKTWIAIDKTDGPNRGNIYAAWNIAGNTYTPNTYNRLLYNETNFSFPSEIHKIPIFGTLDIDSSGKLYIVGLDGALQNLGLIYLIISANPELSTPYFHQVTPVNMGGALRIGGVVNSVGLDGQLYVKLDKSNRQSKNNVYMLASIDPVGGDPLDIHFLRSTDGGISFTDPIKINTDSATNWQWFGTMSVAPNGRIDIIWNDTRNDDGSLGNKFTSKLYYTYSYDAGMTFAKEQAMGPEFNHLRGYPVQKKMGDYIDIQSDNLGAHIAYSATYNDEQDVYYLYAKPSAIEENPDFPSLLTNNVWAVEGVPSQGVLSTTLINNGNPENPLLGFEAIFTATPDGTPIWLVATGEIPKHGDSYTVPLLMPTGDLSTGGVPLLAIGTMTKSRLRDDNNELINNKLFYTFNMTDSVKQELQESLGSKYNEEFFNNNPFYNLEKELVFSSLLPREQDRKDLCNIHGQFLTSQGEKSEGRIQYVFNVESELKVFAADFTYKKRVDEQGAASYELNEHGFAQPIWQVIQSNEFGVLQDGSVENRISIPNGGLGFFEEGNETGITDIAIEHVIQQGHQLITVKSDNTTEIMQVLAYNAYCGEI